MTRQEENKTERETIRDMVMKLLAEMWVERIDGLSTDLWVGDKGMKIPKSIKIGGHTYEVVFCDDLWMHEGNIGQSRHNTKQRIEIEPKLHPDQIGCTFLHEVTHAINRVYNNNQLGEADVAAISEGLFQVLSDMGIVFERAK